MEDFINGHLKGHDSSNNQINTIKEELMSKFEDATDEEKQEILRLINLSNNQELLNYPKLQEIREWLNNDN